MSKQNEPAFPVNDEHLAGQLIKNGQSPEGMSKRFYAACKAMQQLIDSRIFEIKDTNYPQHTIIDRKNLVKEAYKVADEMIKQEEL